ncbi:carbohydrate sulfotransferase 1-like [Glandiceps talaboti]
MKNILKKQYGHNYEVLNRILQNLENDNVDFKDAGKSSLHGKSNHLSDPSHGIVLPDEMKDSVDEKDNSQPINVLVVASMRTGSSFVGELFKQNPDFLYIFEPLRALQLGDNDPLLPVQGIEMFEDMYTCNFSTPTTMDFLNKLYNPRIPVGKKDIVRAWVDDSSQECGAHDTYCHRMNSKTASHSCNGYKYRSIKTIRLQDLNLLVYLMSHHQVQLRIINVMRDPRAMMASVMPLQLGKYRKASKRDTHFVLKTEHLDEDLLHRLNVYCTTMLHNILLGTKGKWLPKNKYFPLRYEDMANSPMTIAEKIYDFLGISLHTNVRNWLERNTKEDIKGDHGMYAYLTKRNSTATAQSWRSRITFDLAKVIENTGDCPQFMELLRYKKVKTPEMLQDVSISLTD